MCFFKFVKFINIINNGYLSEDGMNRVQHILKETILGVRDDEYQD